jgi:predicted dehydrogenase
VTRGRAIGVGVAGYGYWGPNLVRNLIERPEFDLLGLCELSEERTNEFSRRYPGVPTYTELDRLLADPDLKAVAIATPPSTHYPLVLQALEAGKHVLVEKPLATTRAHALELIEVADAAGLVLMPGHTFLYSPPVNKVRNLIDEDLLGQIYFVTSSRMNLGKYQPGGVICDLAPHDLSILMYWLQRPVVNIAATAQGIFQDGVHETAFLTLTFEGDTTANIQISWLAPRKIREMVVVGSKRMIQYEDTAADDSIRIYDRGLEFSQPEPANFGEYRLIYRSGDMVAPRIEAVEPLSLELQDFARAIETGETPRSNAALGLEIVEAIEAAEASLQRGGEPMPVPLTPELAAETNGHANGHGNGHAANGNGRFVHRGGAAHDDEASEPVASI